MKARKINEAQNHIENAEKAYSLRPISIDWSAFHSLKTSFFKRKPDYHTASSEYFEAGMVVPHPSDSDPSLSPVLLRRWGSRQCHSLLRGICGYGWQSMTSSISLYSPFLLSLKLIWVVVKSWRSALWYWFVLKINHEWFLVVITETREGLWIRRLWVLRALLKEAPLCQRDEPCRWGLDEGCQVRIGYRSLIPLGLLRSTLPRRVSTTGSRPATWWSYVELWLSLHQLEFRSWWFRCWYLQKHIE